MKLVIFGAGRAAEMMFEYISKDTSCEIVAFTAHSSFVDKDEHMGHPFVPFENIEKTHPPDTHTIFVAAGYNKVNKDRANMYEQAKAKGFKFYSYVHPTAIVGDKAELGENCFIFEKCVIQPFAKVGNDVIIWSGAQILHHSDIGDHCFVSSNVVIAGDTIVEPRCFIGINATLRNGIRVGTECVVGAGTLLLEDAEPRQVFIGTSTAPSGLDSRNLRAI